MSEGSFLEAADEALKMALEQRAMAVAKFHEDAPMSALEHESMSQGMIRVASRLYALAGDDARANHAYLEFAAAESVPWSEPVNAERSKGA